MKAIITGATSGLGRNMLELLQKKGWDVLAFGRNEEIAKSLGCRYEVFDLSDEEKTLMYFEEVDYVFHCAALSSPWGEYEEFYKANVVATANVIKAVAHYNIKKLIHVSTPSIYFAFESHLGVKEEYLPKKFVNHYAQTKYEAELLVQKSNINAVIIRPRGIFGEYDQVLVPRLEKIAQKGSLPSVKDREVVVDVTYVGNVVYAMYLAAVKDVPNKTVFNITNDEPMALNEVLLKVMTAIGVDVKFKEIPHFVLMGIATLLETLSKVGLIGEPVVTKYSIGVISNSQTLDISKAKELLGYEPIYTIDEGVAKYAKYRNL